MNWSSSWRMILWGRSCCHLPVGRSVGLRCTILLNIKFGLTLCRKTIQGHIPFILLNTWLPQRMRKHLGFHPCLVLNLIQTQKYKINTAWPAAFEAGVKKLLCISCGKDASGRRECLLGNGICGHKPRGSQTSSWIHEFMVEPRKRSMERKESALDGKNTPA